MMYLPVYSVLRNSYILDLYKTCNMLYKIDIYFIVVIAFRLPNWSMLHQGDQRYVPRTTRGCCLHQTVMLCNDRPGLGTPV